MSQEINSQKSFTYKKNGVTITRSVNTTYDAAGNGNIGQVVSVGTSDETLDKGDVSTPGMLYARNLDATNFLDIGPDGTVYPIRLKPGCDCLLQWNGSAIHVKANTAPCLLEYVLIEA